MNRGLAPKPRVISWFHAVTETSLYSMQLVRVKSGEDVYSPRLSNSWFSNYPTATHMFDCMTCQVIVSLIFPKYFRAKISEIWRQMGSQIAAEKYLILVWATCICSSFTSAIQWSKIKLEDYIKCVLYNWGVEMWAGLNCYETESNTKCYKCTKRDRRVVFLNSRIFFSF